MGIFATGPTLKDAKIAMDVGLNSLSVILNASKFGKFTSIPEKEIFRMEYWPLELAKIKTSSLRLKEKCYCHHRWIRCNRICNS